MNQQWSSYQLAIFKNIAEGKGHTVAIARAGSGKTTTIMEGLKHVPTKKTCLMVAFNKKIKDELANRAPHGVEVETLHGYGFRQVRAAFGRVNLNKYKVEGLYRRVFGEEVFDEDKYESLDAAQKANDTWFEVSSAAWPVIQSLCKTVSLAKANLVGLVDEDEEDEAFLGLARKAIEDIMDTYAIDPGYGDETCDRCQGEKSSQRCERCGGKGTISSEEKRKEFIENVMWGLQESKKLTDVIDFDDMVWFPIVHNLRCWQFDRVFIDETQDLNAAQIELALRACKRDGRIFAVGDDRQAIYGFRGADANAVNNVIERLKAKVMKLTVCYRCALSIVQEAALTVPDFEPAPGAIQGLVKQDVSELELRQGAAPGDFVLSRANAPLITLCWAFIREGKPATIQGRDFAGALIGMINKARKSTVLDPEVKRKVPVRTVENFLDWVDAWQMEEIKRLRKKRKDTQSVEDRVACFQALCDGVQSLDEVVAKCESLFGDADDDMKQIVLSSTHKAKGLERKRVWVLKDTYRKRPGIEEDNLWYVAVTRAQVELFLVVGVGGGQKKKWKVKQTASQGEAAAV